LPKRPLAQMLMIGVIAVVIGIPVALVIPWFPANGSIQSSNVRTLYDVLLIASVPIFVLVETVVLYSVFKFRMKPGEEEKDGPPIHGNTRLEVVWTAFPAIILVSLCTYAYTVLHSNEKSRQGEMVVNVTERQFAFEFSYPKSGGKQVVSSELYLPQGAPVVFHIRALDVIQFSEKLDAVPGITTTLRVTPTRLGTYPAECTELCGAGHSLMRATVRVVSPSSFKTWMSGQKVNGPPPIGTPPSAADQPGIPGGKGASGSASSSGSSGSNSSASSGSGSAGVSAGKTAFTGAGGCGSCHTLAAAGTTGTVGPNLTQRLKSDCAAPASIKVRGKTLSQCIQTAIIKPYAYLPSGYQAHIMPANFATTLGSTQIQALVAYLTSVTK
jgi:cytochrome c oxidase subunit 2